MFLLPASLACGSGDRRGAPDEPRHLAHKVTDPELDELLAQARQSADPTERAEYYGQAQELLPELAPAVPLHSRARTFAAQPYVGGVGWDYAWPQPYLYEAWVNR